MATPRQRPGAFEQLTFQASGFGNALVLGGTTATVVGFNRFVFLPAGLEVPAGIIEAAVGGILYANLSSPATLRSTGAVAAQSVAGGIFAGGVATVVGELVRGR